MHLPFSRRHGRVISAEFFAVFLLFLSKKELYVVKSEVPGARRARVGRSRVVGVAIEVDSDIHSRKRVDTHDNMPSMTGLEGEGGPGVKSGK